MVKSLIVCVFVLCFLALGSCEPVEFTDCGSKEAKIVSVDITPCKAQPCELKKGTEVAIQVQFTPNINITAGTTDVHGIISGIPVPFPVDNPDACKDHGIVCPMIAGKTYTFKTVLPIKSLYPAMKLLVKWAMKDQKGNVVYCWEVAAEITG
ncbi:Phosphatidylglycerol/phosphatidylinositol transfer protein [Desmophyllum pertusum]|uniref:Phosphatidylglycerol/phosphatidylinositol transfer protein n=1 Tax=Desmophyllum pertusum TaxID=174260 RepID=A0A9W9YMG6_9CNID|nr:Phosphatidylglycerol/phosphatidylinositol transfer protein [Desmophyllum pertusum]